jgi:hypothetical protein
MSALQVGVKIKIFGKWRLLYRHQCGERAVRREGIGPKDPY